MWPFGRRREAADETRCASCGRTLLAGEWTQRIIENDGSEVLICSLCSQSRSSLPVPADAPPADGDQRPTPNGRETKRRSDAFWVALKEKDAEIEDLHARLARTEAEKQGLIAELAALRGAGAAAVDASGAAGDAATLAAVLGPGAAGAHEAALESDAAAALAEADADAGEALSTASELETATAGSESARDAAAATGLEAAAAADGFTSPAESEAASAPAATGAAAGSEAAEEEAEPPAGEAHEGDLEDTLPGTLSADEILGEAGGEELVAEGEGLLAAEAAVADDYLTEEELHQVQRGVDILNVSTVPKKVAETSQSLGVPFVYVSLGRDAGIDVTYVWPLGWYRFTVLTEGSGSVRLAERGYEERAELQPNGAVRSDGTVQLSPTFGKRPTPREETAADVEPSVSTASVTSGVIMSKSLMGQRTDDEAVVPWEGQNARDFDWGR